MDDIVKPKERFWGTETRRFSFAELVADGIIHIVGIVVALVAGSMLLVLAAQYTAPDALVQLSIYVATLIAVFTCSLVFNLWPVSPVKAYLARVDQAAIFLFIAGTYTPFLATLGDSMLSEIMLVAIWGAALVGVALKLVVPERFGRMAILLYLAIGWSGVLIFHKLATTLPPSTLWLLLAGGITYSLGIIFHVWQRLRFHNALWHAFVLIGATLHLGAIIDCMVLSRL